MASVKPIQRSFSSGELSPLLYGRADIENYRSGCKQMVNFIADARGPARGREGTDHFARITAPGGRNFTLQTRESSFLLGVLTPNGIALYNEAGNPVRKNLIGDPTFPVGQVSWTPDVTINSSVTFRDQDCRLLAQNAGTELVADPGFTGFGAVWTEREVGAGSTVTYSLGSVLLQPGAQANRYAGVAQQISITTPGIAHALQINGIFTDGPVRVRVGLSEGTGELVDTVFSSSGDFISFTPAGDVWITIDFFGPSGNVTLTNVSVFDPSPGYASISQTISIAEELSYVFNVRQNANRAAVSEIRVQLGTGIGDGTYIDEVMDTASFTRIVVLPVGDVTVTITQDSVGEASVGLVVLANDLPAYVGTTPWPLEALNDVHIVPMPESNELHFMHPNFPPYRLTYDAGTQTLGWGAVPTEGFPTDWQGEGIGIGNWPRTGCYFWGRLWYAGPPNSPQQFWGSSTKDKLDFLPPTADQTPEDPITYIIQKYGEIRWIEGTKTLLIGTNVAEYVVFSSSRFTDVTEVPDIQQQSAYGSCGVQPRQVGDQLFYVTSDRRKLRAIQYNNDSDNWLSNDLTFVSEHITRSGIVSIGWVQNPNNLCYAVLGNGEMAALIYQRDKATWGWSRFITSGKILSAASAQRNGTDRLSVLVERVSGFVDLEFATSHRSGFVDASVAVSSATPFSEVSGLGHLEGRIVQVLVDNVNDPSRYENPLVVHPDRVVSNGKIVLQDEVTQAVVGLQYIPKIETMDMEFMTQSGTTVDDLKMLNSIFVRLRNAAGAVINGENTLLRHPSTPMNTREPDASEMHEVTGMDWTEEATITIEQPLPLPITVVYIGVEMKIGNL